MNILLITPLYSIEGRESLERNTDAIHHLVKHWQKCEEVNLLIINTYLNPGRNIAFLLKKGELRNYKTHYDYTVDGVKVHLIEVQQIPFQKKFWGFQNRKIINTINFVIEKRDFDPDIIIAHFPIRYLGVMDKLKSKALKVAVMHFTDLRLLKKYTSQITEFNKLFDLVYTRSEAIKCGAKALGIERLSEFIVNSGVPYSKCPTRNNISMNKKIQLIYVGKLIERKHAEYVIEALGRLKDTFDFQFKIIGKGPLKDKFVQKVKQVRIENRVEFIDSLSREEVYYEMSQSEIFIMPSVQETLGLVYLEAMLHGCITIGTEGEGIDGIIKNGENGFLVKSLSPESVYQCLKDIFLMPDDELIRISKFATLSGNHYNEEDMSGAYLSEIRSNKKVII